MLPAIAPAIDNTIVNDVVVVKIISGGMNVNSHPVVFLSLKSYWYISFKKNANAIADEKIANTANVFPAIAAIMLICARLIVATG